MKSLVLYSRPGCHLCEMLLEDLQPMLVGKATVTIVDISEDPGLERRYGLRIPVLAADGKELSAYPLDHERVAGFLSER